MFRKEIKFIYDFNLNKVRKLGSYLTFEQIKKAEIHPAVLHYISAEIDYLIFEDRQKILKDSIFDYSGEKISNYFEQIGEEVKKNKRFSLEYIAQLILHSSSFTANYLARPRWALMKLIFEDEEHKSTTEIKQILNYVYYYSYLKKIITSYINRKKILSLNYDEFEDLLNKIDDLGFQSDKQTILESAIQSMADFFNIGETRKHWIPAQSVELFLREKGLTDHLVAMRNAFPQDEKLVFDINDFRKVFSTVKIDQKEELPKIEIQLVEDMEESPVKVNKDFNDNDAENIESDTAESKPDIKTGTEEKLSIEKTEDDINELDSAPMENEKESIDDDVPNPPESTAGVEGIIDDEIVTSDFFNSAEEPVSEDEKEVAEETDAEGESNISVTINDAAPVVLDENIEETEVDNKIGEVPEDAGENPAQAPESYDVKHDEIMNEEDTNEKDADIEELNDTVEKFASGDEIIDFDDMELDKSSDIDDFELIDEPVELEESREEEPEHPAQSEPESLDDNEIKMIDDPGNGDVKEDNLESLIYDLPIAELVDEDKNIDEADTLKENELNEPEEENIEEKVIPENIEEAETTGPEITSEQDTFEDDELSLFNSLSEEEIGVKEDDRQDKTELSVDDSEEERETVGSINDDGVTPDDEELKRVSELEEENDEYPAGDVNLDESGSEEVKFEISELLERKNMTKVIEVIFDYDIEEFANVIDSACKASNCEEANVILEDLFKLNHVNSSSKEAETLKSIISEFFDQKEK